MTEIFPFEIDSQPVVTDPSGLFEIDTDEIETDSTGQFEI